MKELEKIAGKRMPYKEDNDYVARLIARSADVAVRKSSRSEKRNVIMRLGRVLIPVAAVLLLVVLLFTNLNNESEYEKYQNAMTLSEVLNSLSDEELMCVSSYVIEDIPEYEQ